MDIKNEKELIEWVYDMHLQNLSGREDFTEAFKNGIEATIEELKELKFLNLPFVSNNEVRVKFCEVCQKWVNPEKCQHCGNTDLVPDWTV